MNYQTLITKELKEGVDIKQKIVEDKELIKRIEEAAKLIIDTFKKEKKVVLFGNGGSAADAQHIAAEFVGRFKKERPALPAIALTTDTSILTAISNDYNFAEVFVRQVKAIVNKEDTVVGITTSGNSENVILGIQEANKIGAKTIVLVGGDGGRIKELPNVCITVPSYNTPRIQEIHIAIGHIICKIVEDALF